MTRFIAADLAGLPPPDAVETLSRDALFEARRVDLSDAAVEAGIDGIYELLGINDELLTLDQQTNAGFELVVRQRINECVRAVLVASSTGANLDHIIATFYGVARHDGEQDDVFRARGVLSMEGRSDNGPEGAYAYHALEASADVKDVRVYAEEDGAVFADATPLIAPDILVVVLSAIGDGSPDQALLDTVLADLSAEGIGAEGDKKVVEPAEITTYRIVATLQHRPGANVVTMLHRAETAAAEFVETNHRIANTIDRLIIGAALKVPDVIKIDLVEPAEDVDPGSKGAAYCTEILLTPEDLEDVWR